MEFNLPHMRVSEGKKAHTHIIMKPNNIMINMTADGLRIEM